MKIGIIGGGIAGLTAAYDLSKRGHRVSVFEKNDELGGQTATFKVGGENLERFYHHIFTGDTEVISLLDELGLSYRLRWLESNVGNYFQGIFYPFATPNDLLRFAPLNMIDRVRLGLITLRLQRHKNWRDFEGITAQDWIIKNAGRRIFEVVWEPLLRGKFGEKAKDVGMVWFWGKIHLRLASRGKAMQKEQLGYLLGSFGKVTETLARRIKALSGEINTSLPVEKIVVEGNRATGLKTSRGIAPCDAIIATIPSPAFLELLQAVPSDFTQKLISVPYQAAVCMVMSMKKSFSPFYWLNISDSNIPFVALIEHTNLVDTRHYGGKRILYISNYLSIDSPLYRKDADGLLAEYLPHLKKINADFDTNWIEDIHVFREEAAQPVIGTNYSKNIPPHLTPIDGLYLANTTQIYPEDRGMNYSIRLGHEVSNLI